MSLYCINCLKPSGEAMFVTMLMHRGSSFTLYGKCFARTLFSSSLVAKSPNTLRYNKDIVISNVDKKEESPLVVIVGWSNSKLGQIAKYSRLYEKHGCTTISVVCPMYRFSMFYDTLFSKDTMACINAMKSQQTINRDRKVFFQLFSTPGPAMYVNIMNYYYQYILSHFGTDQYRKAEDELAPNICGVIYDSPTVASGNAAQFANGMKGNSKNVVAVAAFNVLGKLVYEYAVRTSKMHKYGPDFMKNIPVLIPQLMLFSEKDNIACHKAIIDFVEYQKSIGAFIDSHMWKSSRHVLHYRQYPEEYENLVSKFLLKCLSDNDQSAFDDSLMQGKI